MPVRNRSFKERDNAVTRSERVFRYTILTREVDLNTFNLPGALEKGWKSASTAVEGNARGRRSGCGRLC